MTTAPARLSFPPPTRFRFANLMTVLLVCLACATIGCSKPAPVVTYTIPTKVPEQLRAGKERMLAAMFPNGDAVWFFKVTGPEQAIAEIDARFQQFVQEVPFRDGSPDLSSLPEGWRRGAEKQFRFATVDVNTPLKQLDISISKLALKDDWDAQVQSNVNRWRGQLGLSASEKKWADGKTLDVAAADASGIWVDLIGTKSDSGPSMSAPFAGQFSGSPGPVSSPQASAGGAGGSEPADVPATTESAEEPLTFDLPEGWRDGRRTSMRLAAFNAGPVDSQAELTVIPAGGDLRGNVARWLGQIRSQEVSDEVVDQAMADAEKFEVDGRQAQRFFLSGDDATKGDAIDATIIPIDEGSSLFVKMTGPAQTVTEQADAIASFLKSLKLKL
jgi:hypothetical protein